LSLVDENDGRIGERPDLAQKKGRIPLVVLSHRRKLERNGYHMLTSLEFFLDQPGLSNLAWSEKQR
jgi:hypothetical protein